MLRETLAVGLLMSLGAAAPAQVQPAKLLPALTQAQQEEAQKEKAKRLVVGDKAPPLMIAEWVKGDPVKQFESGKVYVVEFWATWCGPCIAGMPHLSELQEQYKDEGVRFVGVNIWDEPEKVAPFMKSRTSRTGEPLKSGDELMQYTVAIEEKEEDGETGKMAEAWMKAAGQRGIPTAFIVNKEGRVAWIGHPMGMDEPLEQIVAGTWDLAKEVERARKAAEAAERAEPIMRRLQQANRDGDAEAQIKAIDELVALDAKAYGQFTMRKFMIMLTDQQNYKKAYAYGRELAAGQFKDDANALNEISWTVLTDPAIEERDLDFALATAIRANELTDSENPAILDTLAKAYFDKGNVESALHYQEMAVEKAEEYPQMLEELQERLEEYREAKSKG